MLALSIRGSSVRSSMSLKVPMEIIFIGILLAHDAVLLLAGLINLHLPVSNMAFRAHASLWLQFDALIYEHIGQYGYTAGTSTAFFPFLPIVIHFLSPWGTLILEQVVMYGCMRLLYSFALRWLGEPKDAWFAVWLFAIGPCAVYYTSLYAELWTLFFVLAAIELIISGRYALAFAVSGLCSATQGDAVLMGIFPLAMLGFSILQRDRRATLIAVLWGLSCAVGILAYMAYLQTKFGDAFMFSQVQSVGWGAHWVAPWSTLTAIGAEILHRNAKFVAAILLPFVVVAFGSVVATLRGGPRNWVGYGAKAYALLGLLVSLMFATEYPLHSSIRILSVFFPVYLGLAQIRSTSLRRLIAIISLFSCVVGTSLYVHGYFYQ